MTRAPSCTDPSQITKKTDVKQRVQETVGLKAVKVGSSRDRAEATAALASAAKSASEQDTATKFYKIWCEWRFAVPGSEV